MPLKKFNEFVNESVMNEGKNIENSLYKIGKNELKRIITKIADLNEIVSIPLLIVGKAVDYMKENCPKNKFKFINIDKVSEGEWKGLEEWDNFGIKDEKKETLVFFTKSFEDENVLSKFFNYAFDTKDEKQKIIVCVEKLPKQLSLFTVGRFMMYTYEGEQGNRHGHAFEYEE